MTVDVNGTTLFYERTGNGPPLLLLHGNGEDHRIFDPLAEKLAAMFTVYALDSRGHGRSAPIDDYNYDEMEQDVYEFTCALSLPPVNIVGFSDGAIIALLLAMRHPEVVARMALLGLNLHPSDLTPDSRRWIADTFERTRDPLFYLMLTQPDIPIDDVRAVHTPALLVMGEHDMIRADLLDELLAAMPHAQGKVMPGHTHDSYITGSDVLYPDLMAFFSTRPS